MRPPGTACLCVGLLALTAAAYTPVWRNDLVDFDDEVYLTTKPGVLGGLSWSGFCWAWTNEEAPYRLPITWLSWQVDAHFFSARTAQGEVVLCPAAFHGQNLFWHAASVLLLFALWDRLTGARWRAFLIAGLFAVHPMHVESVAWASERKDVLSGFFGLATLWAYVGYVQRPGRGRYLAMTTAFLVSLLAKPMLITLPFVLLLLDRWPLGRRVAPGRLVLEKVPLFALAVLFAALTLQTREQHGALVSTVTVPFSARLANALTGYGWYVLRTFWPTNLAVLYPHPYRNWSAAQALAGAAVLLGVTVLCLREARRRPYLIVGWLWFVGTLLPVMGLAQGGRQAWADRFSYWPHIGLFAAVVWGLGELAGRLRAPGSVSAVLGALVLGWLGALTWVQVGYWQDSATLWEHTLAVTRDNDQAHERLSVLYRKQGRIDEAEAHMAEANRIQVERLRGPAKGPPHGPPFVGPVLPRQ